MGMMAWLLTAAVAAAPQVELSTLAGEQHTGRLERLQEIENSNFYSCRSGDFFAFSTVAELLQSRIPGLTVTRDGDGGVHWYMRGQGSLSGSAPLVLVDDVRTLTGASMPELVGRPPALEAIDIENVQRIEVLGDGAPCHMRRGYAVDCHGRGVAASPFRDPQLPTNNRNID
jgi:hypothetical protein